jgi:hypothetical protein
VSTNQFTSAAARQMRADSDRVLGALTDYIGPQVDDYGNPTDGSRIIYCCFPDCGCDGARLCMAEKGASSCACAMNIERGSLPMLTGEMR